MANEIETQQKSGQTRRSFLAKMGLSVTAFAFFGGPLGMLGLRNQQKKAEIQEFHGEDSIFHPARDPRLDSRRS